jgi:hypothetical protein
MSAPKMRGNAGNHVLKHLHRESFGWVLQRLQCYQHCIVLNRAECHDCCAIWQHRQFFGQIAIAGFHQCRPVRFAPCILGARPTIKNGDFALPNDGTGRAK